MIREVLEHYGSDIQGNRKGLCLGRRKLVYGLGTNDADYQTQEYGIVEGVRKLTWLCPFYQRWMAMLKRVKFSAGEKTVCESWLLFSNFKLWMSEQKWKGLELDKDTIKPGNLHYSPETCCFIPKQLNALVKTNKVYKKDFLLGVYKDKGKNRIKRYKMQVEVFNPSKDRQEKISKRFHTEREAHKSWQLEKANQIEKAINWYAQQDCFDTRVAEAFMEKVWKLRLDSTSGEITVEL